MDWKEDTDKHSQHSQISAFMDGLTYSGELRFKPSCVKSWPLAKPATIGSSERILARKPARPYRSDSLISSGFCDAGMSPVDGGGGSKSE